ncbi:MAG: glycosyltransferase family 39 protein [Polyangiaceae bacterium]
MTTRTSSPPSRRLSGLVLLALVVVIMAASLFGPIASSGIWDPHELQVADLSRRIALTLLGGGPDLALVDAENGVPTLGDLARGQLPFTSVALGFRLFGLHEWAGRLPLALWGLLGAAATYTLVARLADRIAGAFAVLSLVTMPLYFLHARTMLGDIVPMSALAIASLGLALAVFDDSLSIARRLAWVLVGLLGLGAGYAARGALLGVATPALGVGLAHLVTSTRGSAPGRRALGAFSLLVGVAAFAFGVRALGQAEAEPTRFIAAVGAQLAPPRQMPTFEAVIHYLGHGLFPWSAVVPFCVGRVLRPPPGAEATEIDRQAGLRATLLLVAAVALFVHGLLAPKIGMLPYLGVFALAGMVGVTFRDYERGAPPSRALAMGVAALAVLLYTDFKNFPEKGLSAFVVEGARFPDSFKESATRLIKYGTVAMSGLFFVAFLERGSKERRLRDDEVRAYFDALRTTAKGNVWFSLLVAEAALAGYALLAFLSQRYLHLKQFEGMSPAARGLASYGFLALPVLVLVVPPAAILGRDLARWALDLLPWSRARVALLSVVAFGGAMSLGYYPALAAQISPKEVFDAYRRLAAPGEQLGILGVGSGSANYYAGRDAPSFGTAPQAFEWLVGEPNERRWLVLRSSDLAQLNSSFRGRANPPQNLPVLDARSSEILLASNRLASGQANANPFAPWLPVEEPKPTRPLTHNLGGQLDVLGWDVTTRDGSPVASVVPRKPYDFRIYYKVVAPISGNWETFIHIDGFQRRYNGDHKTLEGRYPFHLWRAGDFVVDIHPFSLEPNFTPGDYSVFFGLFIGNRRLDVKRGRHNDNRVEAGTLRID